MKRFYMQGISEQEVKLLKTMQENGKSLITTKELKEVMQFNHLSNLLHNLKRKGLVIQLERGKYILSGSEIDSFLLGTKLIEPSAIAYYSALNHYGLTEQISNVIYIQTTKRKKKREILNVRYKFITIATHKLFGIRKEWVGPDNYFITNMEKTIIDCFDMPENAGGLPEVIKGFFLSHERLDKERLWRYAMLLGNNTVMKRIAYLSEILGMNGFDDFRMKARGKLLTTYTVLDPFLPKKGRHLKKWCLLLNRTEDEIFAMIKTVV